MFSFCTSIKTTLLFYFSLINTTKEKQSTHGRQLNFFLYHKVYIDGMRRKKYVWSNFNSPSLKESRWCPQEQWFHFLCFHQLFCRTPSLGLVVLLSTGHLQTGARTETSVDVWIKSLFQSVWIIWPEWNSLIQAQRRTAASRSRHKRYG